MAILDELKLEAERVRQSNASESQRQASLQRRYQDEICPTLVEIHRYLYDLVEQLKVVTWNVEANYEFPGIGNVTNLVQEDYRVHIDSTDRPTRVTLNLACRHPVSRQYIVNRKDADELRDFLYAQEASYGTRPYSGPDTKEGQKMIIDSRIHVKSSIVVEADIANSGIAMHIINFDNQPMVALNMLCSEIDNQWLDRLGNYVLRRTDTFGKQNILNESERESLRVHLQEARRLERRGIPRSERGETDRAATGGRRILEKLRSLLFRESSK